ncbi:hypothetical protein RS3R1_04630 [Pseudomonas atacamensis]|uniref:Uncharacterized protein n=1 Tax=Pseudomonas atacamensis TaxID=2565368 RepID=A0ABQ5PCY1_9PSED|nr:hypothetical protein RS3R1_04630 [Pseudomonas atacamensis]
MKIAPKICHQESVSIFTASWLSITPLKENPAPKPSFAPSIGKTQNAALKISMLAMSSSVKAAMRWLN